MVTLNLEALAADTAQRLHTVWDEMGVPVGERDDFLAKLSKDVATIYQHRVEHQQARKHNVEAEIVQLQAMISSLQKSMEEALEQPSGAGLTLLQFRDGLEGKRSTLQQAWDKRYNELRSLEKALFQLYGDIAAGVEPAFAAMGDVMSFSRIAEYNAEILRTERVKSDRASAIASLCQEITELWQELVVAPCTEFDTAVLTGCAGMGWGLAVVEQLEGRREELLCEKRVREAKVMALGEAITSLWKRLMTPVELQTQFLDAHAGISDAVVAGCEAYLSSLQAEFQSKLTTLIAGARASIAALWDEVRMGGEEERVADFPPYALQQAAEGEEAVEGVSSHFTDDLYQAHEEHMKALSVRLEERRPILTDIVRREGMVADRAEYEAIISDPARLLVKGSSAARLREEKLERRVKKELPALSRRLRERLVEWESTHGGAPFLVDGSRWLDRLDGEEASEAVKAAEDRAKRDAHRKDKAGIHADAPALPGTGAGLGATHSAGLGGAAAPGGRNNMSVYRPAILGATGKGGLGCTQALPAVAKALTRKTSATASTLTGVEEAAGAPTAEAGASRAAGAPAAPALSSKAKSFANIKPAPAHSKGAAAHAGDAPLAAVEATTGVTA